MNRAIPTSILGDGYDFFEAENGVQAVKILTEQHDHINLVLLDMVMPKLNGFGVLSVMNQNHWIDSVPVIMISAESDSVYVERAYQLGVTDYIGRPFDKGGYPSARHQYADALCQAEAPDADGRRAGLQARKKATT